MKLTFKQCTLAVLDKTFSLREVPNLPPLVTWLETQTDITDFERQTLDYLKQRLMEHRHDWNESELGYGFIGPLLTLVNFSSDQFNFFAERTFQGHIGNIELSGQPDGMIATGRREPETPYFCFQEYKREKDPDGDPAGQVLAAMLLAQEINEGQHPVYGCYVKGNIWYFMVLQGVEYSISNSYVATREDIFTIFGVLKALKQIIATFITTE